ncbi:MAG: MBL fold metallo-hydrolase [Firmicutes bacterium]|nr:MBL fold metallo-hydrolase [Bacillota bacterium]
MADIIELEGDIFQLDLKECGDEGRTAGYFVRGKNGWMLLETGPASSAEIILEAVRLLGIKPLQLKYIAVTHIHLDHSGGLGVLSEHFKEAGLILHPRGARHMIDPTRLVAGASTVWGSERMGKYGQTIPAPEERLIYVGEGDTIDLGERKIEVWETPGHSKTHICFYDAGTCGLFGGDALGVFSPGLTRLLQRPVVHSETMAPDFDGELMFRTLLRLAGSGVDRVYFTHFGVGRPPRLLAEILLGQLAVFTEMGRLYCCQGNQGQPGEKPDNLELLALEMERYIREGLLGKAGLPEGADSRAEREWQFLAGMKMVRLSAGGILHYLGKSQG